MSRKHFFTRYTRFANQLIPTRWPPSLVTTLILVSLIIRATVLSAVQHCHLCVMRANYKQTYKITIGTKNKYRITKVRNIYWLYLDMNKFSFQCQLWNSALLNAFFSSNNLSFKKKFASHHLFEKEKKVKTLSWWTWLLQRAVPQPEGRYEKWKKIY